MSERKCANCSWWSANQEKPDLAEGCFPCWNPDVGGDRGGEEGTECSGFLAADSTEVNVPQHTRNGIEMERNSKPVDGPVEILIVTYSKDFPWLEYCLQGLRKFCTGFQGITVAHPNSERELFAPLVPRFDVRLFGYDEVPGKGMLQHMVVMATADQFLPAATKYVMHLDADCIYHTPTTPEDYFLNDKPVYLVRTWDSLSTEDPKNPGSKVISDCHQWKGPTDYQLGLNSEMYTMCRHPTVLPVSFYAVYRRHIEMLHRMDFSKFMLSGRNEFPQDRMDWTAMGEFAWRTMRDQFHWIDIGVHAPPRDRQRAYWSHGGINSEAKHEIEGFLK